MLYVCNSRATSKCFDNAEDAFATLGFLIVDCVLCFRPLEKIKKSSYVDNTTDFRLIFLDMAAWNFIFAKLHNHPWKGLESKHLDKVQWESVLPH